MELHSPISGRRPLTDYAIFESRDLDETREQVARIFCPHRLEIRRNGGELDACHHHAPLSGISLNYIQYGADVLIEPGELESFFLVQMPLKGHAEIRCGRQSNHIGNGNGSILSPSEYVRMTWSSDCEKLIVKIGRAALEKHLSHLLGRPATAPIVFDLTMNLHDEGGASWWRSVHFLREELERDAPVWSEKPVSRQFEDMLMTMLLYGQENNYSDALHAPAAPAAPRHVKLAEEYLREHAASAITIEDLVGLTGVSARTLYEGFKQFRGISPIRFLREIRLENARRELLAADRDRTVTEIATRWHFYQLGRFAKAYRRRFGESPSQTLRR